MGFRQGGQRWTCAAWLGCLLALVTGCVNPVQQGRSPLMPATLSSDAVILDVYFVHCPFDQPELNCQLWNEVDEQQIPAALRERLTRNGFRAGVIGGQLPSALSKLLELKESRKPKERETTIEGEQLVKEPSVERRTMPMRAGMRGEIVTSGIYPELPVLVCGGGEVGGQVYQQAQGVMAVMAKPEGDGRLRIELTPELHHEQPRQRWIGDQGMLRLDTSRPRRVFEDMKTGVALAPGHMLVVASLPSRPGSLGHHFFTDKSKDELQQKLLVIRLSQTQHDELISPSGPLPLENLDPPVEGEAQQPQRGTGQQTRTGT